MEIALQIHVCQGSILYALFQGHQGEPDVLGLILQTFIMKL